MRGWRVWAMAVAALAQAWGAPGAARAQDWSAHWTAPAPPLRIADTVYYVGAEGLSSYLIATSAGHIVLDGGTPLGAPIIAANIRALGFRVEDVKILINSHAHFDHAGGLAGLKAQTGARMVASVKDKPLLEGGYYPGAQKRLEFMFPPVGVDQVIGDGGSVRLGGVALRAHLTPGHSPGCTTWTMRAADGAKTYDIVFFCGASVAANRLVGARATHPGIVDDYRTTFRKARALKADIFLAGHGEFFDLKAKRARLAAGEPNPFVDPAAFPAHIAAAEAAFEKALAEQAAAQEKTP